MSTFRRAVVVDKKKFDLSFNRRWRRLECVGLTERWNGKVFKAECSEEGGKWLGGLLIRLGEGSIFRSLPRFQSKGEVIRAIRKWNAHGEYIQFVFGAEESTTRSQVICVPQGRNGKHWLTVGENLYSLLGVIKKMGQTQDQVESTTTIIAVPQVRRTTISSVRGMGEEQPVIISAWPKPYMSWSSKTNTVEVLSKGVPFGAAWWSSVVLCSGSLSTDCWAEVEDKIKEKFGMREFKNLSDQKAAIFLHSDEDAARLSLMPQLCLGGVVFTFAMWKPECGSLSHISGKDWCLNLIGFPLHLKTEDCIRSVAGVLGKVLEVDLESISMESMKVRVQIHRDNIFDLPRCVSLVENEVVFPIMIEIESPDSKWVDEGLCYFSGSKNLYSKEEEEGSTVLVRKAEQITREGHNSNYTDCVSVDGTGVGEIVAVQPCAMLEIQNLNQTVVDEVSLVQSHGPSLKPIEVLEVPLENLIESPLGMDHITESQKVMDAPNSYTSPAELVGLVAGVGIRSSSDANGSRSLLDLCSAHVDGSSLQVKKKLKVERKAKSWTCLFAHKSAKAWFSGKRRKRSKGKKKKKINSNDVCQFDLDSCTDLCGEISDISVPSRAFKDESSCVQATIDNQLIGFGEKEIATGSLESQGSVPPGFEEVVSKEIVVHESGVETQNEARINMLSCLRNCRTEHEVRVWSKHLAIPLAPMIGVSKRVDGTYGEEDFIKIVLNQKKKSNVGIVASND
ncbi:hypothetical protein FRX31_018140 [Thalictrum thalictroides]|uniref:DUF4283 domain-containing protein n=1 Tax=Thalictrum thalictroides TaxID=46969 RepID=A0A7J6W7E7_THATH|nr:hypothetical protein FRX31_018140 [Thalictrum thalictroides]